MTSMKDTLQADLTDAMRARDDVKVATLRMALAAITKAEVAGKEQVTLSDRDVVGVLRSEMKKRHEAADMYDTGGRADRAVRERAEAEVLAGYLPPAMDDAALGHDRLRGSRHRDGHRRERRQGDGTGRQGRARTRRRRRRRLTHRRRSEVGPRSRRNHGRAGSDLISDP